MAPRAWAPPRCCSEVDPGEDTERREADLSEADLSKVAVRSIRERILKVPPAGPAPRPGEVAVRSIRERILKDPERSGWRGRNCVAVRSIRERILKGGETGRRLRMENCCSEVDPGEDTERLEERGEVVPLVGCSEVDPGEDTESTWSTRLQDPISRLQ